MKGGPALEIEDVDPRVIGQQVVDDIHVALVRGNEQRRPSHGALSIESLLHFGSGHVADHLGQDLVVTGQGAIVEGRLLGLLRLHGDVGAGFDEGAHDRAVVTLLHHLLRLDLGAVMERARALEGQAVDVVGHVDALLLLDELDEVAHDAGATAPAGQVERRLAVLRQASSYRPPWFFCFGWFFSKGAYIHGFAFG